MRLTASSCVLAALLLGCDGQPAEPAGPLRVGYFHGGRNTLLYRAMDAGGYRREGVDVVFYATRSTTDPEFAPLPDSIVEYEKLKQADEANRYFGRTTGPQIIAEMQAGRLDCGMIGESSFLLVVDGGLPWSAIAKQGQDSREAPGKVVVLRAGIQLQGPEDLQGLVMGSRESGPYDKVMAREFIQHQGVELDRVEFLDMIRQEELRAMLKRQELDLAFLHLHLGAEFVEKGLYKVFPGFGFHFADPALSQSLLVCKDTVIQQRRAELVLFLSAYKRRVDFELALTPQERARFSGEKSRGLDLVFFDGLNVPQYSAEPVIDLALLEQMQALLLEHGVVDEARPVAPHVDNSLMLEALERVRSLPAPQVEPVEPFEARTASERLLAVLDQDGDGALSPAEVELVAHKKVHFADFDGDSSGDLDPEELRLLVTSTSPLLPGYRGRGRFEVEGEEPTEANDSFRKALKQMMKKRKKLKKKAAGENEAGVQGPAEGGG